MNRSFRPRVRSLTRGLVTRNSSAASPCLSLRAAIALWRFSSRSARILSDSASSAEKPRSRNTLPVERVILTFATEHLSLPPRTLGEQGAQTMLGEIHIALRRAPSSLLESVQDVHRLWELRDVDHTVLYACTDPDLLHSRSDARQWFPIVRLQAALNPPELESGDLAGIIGEAADRFARITKSDDWLVGHGLIYKNLDAWASRERSATRPTTRSTRARSAGRRSVACRG